MFLVHGHGVLYKQLNPFNKTNLCYQPPVADKMGDDADDRMLDLSELNPAQRITHLERSILFLKQQHAEVLKSLHEEIDGLKKDNKGNDMVAIYLLEEKICNF